MRIAIGSDHAVFDLKEEVKAFLLEENHEVLDVGTYSKAPVDYPDYAEAVATALRENRAERGIILCGSGVGASMAANRIPGIRAGLCHDTYSAHQGVEHDDMNVLMVHGDQNAGGLSKAHRNRLDADDYFALLAYVEMNGAHERVLQSMRHSVRDAQARGDF